MFCKCFFQKYHLGSWHTIFPSGGDLFSAAPNTWIHNGKYCHGLNNGSIEQRAKLTKQWIPNHAEPSRSNFPKLLRMDVCCFKQAAIAAPCKIYCLYSGGTYWPGMCWAEAVVTGRTSRALDLELCILAHCSSQLIHSASVSLHICRYLCTSSCLAFQVKLCRTSQNWFGFEITPRALELHSHFLGKHLRGICVCEPSIWFA